MSNYYTGFFQNYNFYLRFLVKLRRKFALMNIFQRFFFVDTLVGTFCDNSPVC